MLLDDNKKLPRWQSALVAKELEQLNIDIVALAEMQFIDVGDRKEAKYTFFWSGVSSMSSKKEHQEQALQSQTGSWKV